MKYSSKWLACNLPLLTDLSTLVVIQFFLWLLILVLFVIFYPFLALQGAFSIRNFEFQLNQPVRFAVAALLLFLLFLIFLFHPLPLSGLLTFQAISFLVLGFVDMYLFITILLIPRWLFITLFIKFPDSVKIFFPFFSEFHLLIIRFYFFIWLFLFSSNVLIYFIPGILFTELASTYATLMTSVVLFFLFHVWNPCVPYGSWECQCRLCLLI